MVIAQKLLGWFGGYGFKGTLGYFTGSGIPAPLALLAIGLAVALIIGGAGLWSLDACVGSGRLSR